MKKLMKEPIFYALGLIRKSDDNCLDKVYTSIKNLPFRISSSG